MNLEMQKRALAARDAHDALLELKKLVEEAAQAAHAAEREAVHLALSPRSGGDVRKSLRMVKDQLESPNFESTLSRVREKLENAAA
jgi:hypothetical protein